MSTTDLRQTELCSVIPLTCSSWHSFAERYIDDLARGALCVAYPEPLPLLSPVTVQLSLPEAIEITLPARVVHVMTGPHAEHFGGTCALALELDVEGETKRQLAQLVEFARTQRDGDSAEASFTHAMLEQTPSLPPRELALRLSSMPTASPSASPKRAAGSSSPLTAAASTTYAAEGLGGMTNESGYRHAAAAPRLRSDDVTRPLSPARLSRAIRGGKTDADAPQEGAEPVAPDPLKLKELLSSVARKQYDTALRITNELLQANPNDKQTQRWRALCYARIALTRNDRALAAQAYQAMLAIDPNDREAREFLKAHERTKKLESLPFGRFFTKNK